MKRFLIYNLIFILFLSLVGIGQNNLHVSLSDPESVAVKENHFFFQEANTPISPIYKTENTISGNNFSVQLNFYQPGNNFKFYKFTPSLYYPNYGFAFIDRCPISFRETDLPPPSLV